MADSVKWFDRRFDFDFPTGLYPQVMERLRGTPARVEDHINSIPERRLSVREGKSWSINENVGHLIDVEHLMAGRLDDFAGRVETLRAADRQNHRTYEAHYNDKSIESIASEFRRVRGATIARLEQLPPDEFGRRALHPRLAAPMRLVDLMVFHAEHDDHHLARVTEMSRLLSAAMVNKAVGERSVLICDDKAYMRSVIGKVVKKLGVVVVAEAETGSQAVKRYRELNPDLVTMDILMPEKSGLDAVREILAFDPAARILVCSGLGEEALVAEAMGAGAMGYLLKPFTLSDLLEAVQNLL